jgi:hypothetical protein
MMGFGITHQKGKFLTEIPKRVLGSLTKKENFDRDSEKGLGNRSQNQSMKDRI